MRRGRIGLATLALAACAVAPGALGAEAIKIGLTRIANSGPVAVALEKGYFAGEGLAAELVFFDAQQPIAVGVAAGDLDFGVAAETAALYSLAGQGVLRLIAGGVSEMPTFHYLNFLVSNRAYAQGLTSFAQLPGHSFALTQLGSGLQYDLGLVAAKYGFDVKSVTLLPLQSNSAIASAIAGGRADAAIFQSTGAQPLIDRGEAKRLGWLGDETGRDQANLAFTTPKAANQRRDTVERFLRAFRKGGRDYHDAFTDQDEKRRDGPTAPAILAIIAKFLGQPVAMVARGLPYMDAEARLNVADVQRQIDWYRSQGLLKGTFTADALIDKRYVIPLPDP